MSAFASGKNAWGISDRSGRRYRLRDMKREWNGLLVGPDEFEPKHPQLNPRRRVRDPQALKNARPDRREPFTFTLGAPPLGTGPFVPVQANFRLTVLERVQALGLVEVEIETLADTLDRDVDVWLLVGGQYAINGLKWALTAGVWDDNGAWVDDAIWSDTGEQIIDSGFEAQPLKFYKEPLYTQTDSFELQNSTSTLDVTGLSGFDEFLVRVSGVKNVWGTIGLRTSTDNGSSFDEGASDYSFTRLRQAGSSFTVASSTSSSVSVNETLFVTNNVPFSIEVKLHSTSRSVSTEAVGSSDTSSAVTRTSGVRLSGDPVNAIRLVEQSANPFPPGVTVEVYGVN